MAMGTNQGGQLKLTPRYCSARRQLARVRKVGYGSFVGRRGCAQATPAAGVLIIDHWLGGAKSFAAGETAARPPRPPA